MNTLQRRSVYELLNETYPGHNCRIVSNCGRKELFWKGRYPHPADVYDTLLDEGLLGTDKLSGIHWQSESLGKATVSIE